MRNLWSSRNLLVAGVLLTAIIIQTRSINSLERQVADLRAQIEEAPEAEAPVSQLAVRENRPAPVTLGMLPHRVSQLEQMVADLVQVSNSLMDRGITPPSQARLQEMQNAFFNPFASDRDRLRAFQLIRRNGETTDQVMSQALNWMQSSTNAETRRNLLRQIDGMTNSVLRAPLLAMLATEDNPRVREEIVDVLGEFVHDPAVEKTLWDLAVNEEQSDIRREAENALTRGNMTPERLQSLRDKAADSSLPLDTRLLAFRGLDRADQNAPEVASELAAYAQSTTDPLLRAKLFDAFDGHNDPSLLRPLVDGLQDPSPVVRERAADALSGFGTDERVQQWLNYTIQNDTDPRVKREAQRALEQGRRR